MMPRFALAMAALLLAGTGAEAQPLRPGERFIETAEPPLAESAEGIRLATAREAAPNSVPPRFVDSAAPVVQLSVRAPATHAAGNPTPIKLIVENVSRSPASNVVVFYPLPAGATIGQAAPEATPIQGGCAWKFDTLPAATRKEISFTVTSPAEAPELVHKPRVTFEYEQTAPATRFAKAELAIKKYGPDQALKHDILVFVVDVTNTGGADLADVQVVDLLPDGLEHRPMEATTANLPPNEVSADRRTRTFQIGRLGPGQSRRLEYYVAASNAVGPIVHRAAASAAGLAQPAQAESRVTLAEPKLELTVEATPRRPANQTASVRIRLTNRSLRALSNIVVTDRVGPGAQIESLTLGGQQFDGRAQWILPLLGPNETRVLEGVIRCPQGGRVVHQVSAVYRGLTQGAEAATEFEAIAAVQTEFRGSHSAIELNGEVTYTLTIRNLGSSPASNVRAVIQLPAELEVVKSQPSGSRDGGRIAFDAVTIPPSGRLVCTVTARGVKTALNARVRSEVAADVLTAGPIRKQESLSIGGNDPAAPLSPVQAPALPKPAPPKPPQ